MFIADTAPTTSGSQSFLDSGVAQLNSALSTYGLGSLANTVWDWWKSRMPVEQIMLNVRNTPEYKTRFPAMETLGKAGHGISEYDYINLEQQYTAFARQYGLPQGFYDQPDDFAKLIGGEVSPTEFQTRLQDYQALAYDTDPTARNELKRLYGIDEGHIAAYLIDPTRALPILQRQVGAAQVSAAAQHAGYGGLSQAEGELLSNVTPDQAQQGFGQLVGLQQVLGQLPGEPQPGIDRATGLAATFQGDERARLQVEAAQKRRLSVFAEGGGFEQSQKGLAGIGAA